MLLYLVVCALRGIFEFESCILTCFSLAEQKKIEQAALSNKKRKFIGIVICLYSGLRIGELLALTWADIDFTKGTLIVSLKPTTAD